MRFDAFLGGSYESQAATADQERTVNWFPEKLQSPGAPSPRILLPTPGVEIIVSADDDDNANLLGGPGRAHYASRNREFAIIGTGFWEISRDSISLLGSVTAGTDGLPASISSNGDAGGQLFVTAGGNGYFYDLNDEAAGLQPIPALAGIANIGGHLDGYFLALDTTNSRLHVSDLYDGQIWTEFAERSLAPDPWRSMKVAGRTIWLFGEQTSEPWFNTGARFPFAPAVANVAGFGIAAPWSAETLGNDVIWLGLSRDGRVCVLRASGVDPRVISTYPLETKMQGYRSLRDAVADGYSDNGHSFYLLNFDSDDITWAWDLQTGLWSERGTWAPESNKYVSWRPRFYAYAFDQHRMLDTSNGNVYRMSTDLTRDVDGRMIRRQRRAPGISKENKDIAYHSFELDLEPGLGVNRGHVGFRMHATVSTVAGTVTDGDGHVVPDAIVTITVDGDDFGQTITDEEGNYEIEGIPDGTVIVTVAGEDPDTGEPVCGDDTGVTTGPGAGSITAPGYLPLNITVGPCAFEISYTVDINGEGPASTSAYGGGNGLITLTPTVTGGTAPYTYHWRVWDEHTSYLAYRYVDTDEISTQPVSVLGVQAICSGQVRLTVTDATATTVSVGPETSDWQWDCI